MRRTIWGHSKGHRNGRDPTEAEDTEKRWQEHTEELHKKASRPREPRWCDHPLEPDILECKVKWALGSITTNKAGGGDGIPVELFQILKDDAALNMPANLENSAVATGLEKVSPIPKKGNAKKCSNCLTVALISHNSKVKLKVLQARFQQYINCELPDVQAGFRKARNQRSNCQHRLDHQKSKRVPERHLLLLYWLCQSLCVDHNKLWRILRDRNTRPLDLPPEKSVCRSRSNS